jgi:hypothetical protein
MVVVEVVTLTDERTVARYLRNLGFRRRPKRPPSLILPW